MDGVTLGTVNVGRNLNVNASANVTQSGGTTTVGGLTTIAPGASNNVDLHAVAGNNFNQFAVTSAHDVSVLDTDGIALAGISASHDVTVDAGAGAITQTTPVTAPGTMAVSTDTSAGHDVTLTNAGNDFGTFTTGDVRDVSVTDATALNLGGASAGGAFSATTGGPITQSGNPVSAQGTATFNAGSSSDVTLGLANTFPGLRLTAQNATVTVGGPGVDLGLSQITHNLTLAATGGAITQSGGPLTVPDTATFSSPAGVTVADPANNFGTLVVGGAQATAKDANGIVLGASTLTGGLTLEAKGAITQSGVLNFAGSSSLDAGAGNDITLPNPANTFTLLAIPNARDALIEVTGNTNLGTVSTARDLRVEDASGDISAGQAISVGRNTTFDTGAGDDVTVPSGGNQFGGDVTVSGRSATVNAGSALSLGGTTLTGTLDAAAASISQAGAITVGHTVTLVSRPGGIALPNGANDFLGPVRLSSAPGQNATVTDSNDLTLGQSTVGGNLLATAARTLAVPASTEVNAVGTATLVSDAQAPAAPTIGNGGVVMGAGANLQSSGGPIAIFTAKRSQNSIDPTATFNGSKFKPGPLFINTNREVWGTYYPAGSAISPFTIFYKDKGKAAPQTKLKNPKKRWVTTKRHAKIKFAFTSPTANALFLCKLDRRPLRLCKSPFHASVKPGKHRFLVRAELGTVVDPTPSRVKFKVVRR